jgi:ribosomal protein S12 methylthiotransferase accessory factor
VLIPGLQPLNYGHHLRALGGERVVTVAQRMGYATRRRTLDELNPWPHPFW